MSKIRIMKNREPQFGTGYKSLTELNKERIKRREEQQRRYTKATSGRRYSKVKTTVVEDIEKYF